MKQNIVLRHPIDGEPQAFRLEIDFEVLYEIWEVPYLSGWMWKHVDEDRSRPALNRRDAVFQAIEYHRCV